MSGSFPGGCLRRSAKQYTLGRIAIYSLTTALIAVALVLTQSSAAAEPSDSWFVLTNSDHCEISPAGSPAALVVFDRNEGLNDTVEIIERADGKPMIVKVSAPLGSGMHTAYIFIRSEARCEAYAKQQRDRLDELR